MLHHTTACIGASKGLGKWTVACRLQCLLETNETDRSAGMNLNRHEEPVTSFKMVQSGTNTLLVEHYNEAAHQISVMSNIRGMYIVGSCIMLNAAQKARLLYYTCCHHPGNGLLG